MKIVTKQLELKTKGAGDLVDISDSIQDALSQSGLNQGTVTVFVIGSTAAITSFEYEPGLIADMKELYEKVAPSDRSYAHDETWGDANGFIHVRAALQVPSMVIPFKDAQLILGTWQQIVLSEFDTRPRQRQVILQFIGQ